jgi:hypothetical protein
MDEQERQRIYSRISAKGLMAAVVERVRLERPKASRNTIYLAFTLGGTTPAREMILDIASKILEQADEETPQPATA